jgi:hypothetical protein
MSENEKTLGPGAKGDVDNPGERGFAPAVVSPAEQAQRAGEPPAEVLPPSDQGKAKRDQLPDGQKQD